MLSSWWDFEGVAVFELILRNQAINSKIEQFKRILTRRYVSFRGYEITYKFDYSSKINEAWMRCVNTLTIRA